jgi:sugar lactone lactonase YvrE
MHDDQLRRCSRWLGSGRSHLTGAFVLTFLVGCGGDDNGGSPGSDGGPLGDSPGFDVVGQDGGGCTPGADNGTIGTGMAAATGGATFQSPFDATLDPTGTTIYFTALDATGLPGVFKASGGTVTALATGDPLAAPFGITVSDDGTQVYVADPGAAADPTDPTKDAGRLFAIPAAGGTPTPIAGADGYAPSGVEMIFGQNQIYFTGVDPANGNGGIWKIAPTGGTPTLIAEGAPFIDPSGIALDPAGNAYVVDTLASATRLGQVIKVAAGTTMGAALQTGDVQVGYPAGLALSADNTALLVSAFDPSVGTAAVARIVLANPTPAYAAPAAIANNIESAGIHRARCAASFVWADSLAGGNGTVYALSK